MIEKAWKSGYRDTKQAARMTRSMVMQARLICGRWDAGDDHSQDLAVGAAHLND